MTRTPFGDCYPLTCEEEGYSLNDENVCAM